MTLAFVIVLSSLGNAKAVRLERAHGTHSRLLAVWSGLLMRAEPSALSLVAWWKHTRKQPPFSAPSLEGALRYVAMLHKEMAPTEFRS